MHRPHPQTVVTLLFLGGYALGASQGVPAAMLPWQVRTWTCLIMELLGTTNSSGMPTVLALSLDCMALMVMIWADDKITCGVFALSMIDAYAPRSGRE